MLSLRWAYLLWVVYAVIGCTTLPETVQHSARLQQYGQACAFTMRRTAQWTLVTKPETRRTTTLPYDAEGLYYRHQDVQMFIVCTQRDRPFEAWVRSQLSTLGQEHRSFTTVAQEASTFQDAPSFWLLYTGTREGRVGAQHGFVLFIDRGSTGLMVVLTTSSDDERRYSRIFRSGIDTIELL